MGKIFDRTAHNIASGVRGFKNELAEEMPRELGFPFSAWFFIGVVTFTFLDAYFADGRGLGHFIDVPGQVLAHASKLVNV